MAYRLEKAVIKILEGSNKGTEVPVLFNPTEYSLDISNSFEEKSLPGLSNPVVQFVNGQAQSLSMELLFDTWTDGANEDVSKKTNEFTQMLAIDSDLHAPPPVEFKWGSFSFKAYIEKISQRFTMFNSDGSPVRATLNVSLKQYRPLPEQLTKTKLLSSDKTKRRVLTADDSLWAIAAREYGETKYWRQIAAHNRIANPRKLQAGTVIVLPPLEDLEKLENIS
jgi:hypothetical protein